MSARQRKLKGFEQLKRNMNKLSGIVDSREIEKALIKDAVHISGKISRRASRGPTGNLKSAIVGKGFRTKKKGKPASFVAIDYRKAPHAHLVEKGTKSRSVRKKKVLFDKETGTFFGIEVAPMPRRPFFWPVIKSIRKFKFFERTFKKELKRIRA